MLQKRQSAAAGAQGMDVEAATRAFVAALARADAQALAALVAPGAVFDVAGFPGRYPATKALAIVTRKGKPMKLETTHVQVKRNVGFAEVHLAQGSGVDGVLVLSWDQEGKVAHGTMHADVFAWVAALSS